MKWSLVIPCYNEEKNILAMRDACRNVFRGKVESYELIFVNDGSRDNTWKVLKEAAASAECRVKLINFSRNFGKEAAMYAGLQQAEGEYVTIIDADLQQRPEVALEMVQMLEEHPELDCVAAYQEQRRESALLRFFKSGFYRLINRISDVDFFKGASDFRTFRHNVVEAILSMGEYYRFSKGIFAWVGFETYYMPYRAEERNAGQTSWSFRKLFRYAIDGIIAFTTTPLKLATGLGMIMAGFSLLYLIVVVIQKLTIGIDVPGYPTLIVLILLIGGIQMITLGIMGEYIARMYIQEKNRPIYIAKEMITVSPEEESGSGPAAPSTGTDRSGNRR